jgi:flagellar hook assembly protein FlgD
VGLAASPGPLAERLSATFSQVSVVGRAVNVATENKSYPVPTQFELKQNYPNPFVGETKINYTLPVQGRVKVVVYNLAGERVRTFLRENQTAGVHTIRWDGRDTSGARVPSGVYYCVVQAGKKKLAKKMIVLH